MAIDISELTVIYVNLNNICEQPIRKFCLDWNSKVLKGAKFYIIDESNVNFFLKGHKFSEDAFRQKAYSYATDEFRLYFNEFFKYPLYLDTDIIISKDLVKGILENPEVNFYAVGTFLNYLPITTGGLKEIRNMYKKIEYKWQNFDTNVVNMCLEFQKTKLEDRFFHFLLLYFKPMIENFESKTLSVEIEKNMMYIITKKNEVIAKLTACSDLINASKEILENMISYFELDCTIDYESVEKAIAEFNFKK